jgi:hypothetical protein
VHGGVELMRSRSVAVSTVTGTKSTPPPILLRVVCWLPFSRIFVYGRIEIDVSIFVL